MRCVVLVAALALAGCATAYNQKNATDFMPTGDNGFRFKAYADAATPLDGETGERKRMAMLESWLSQNGKCQAGYVIDNRNVVQRSNGIISNTYDVWYDGHCKPSA